MSYEQLYEAYLYVWKRNAIAISFNKDWQPFIGYTTGYNEPDDRTRIFSGCELLKLIQEKLKIWHNAITVDIPNEPRGGRVFIKKECVYRYTYESEIVLFRCVWLGDDKYDTNPVLKTLHCNKILSGKKYRINSHFISPPPAAPAVRRSADAPRLSPAGNRRARSAQPATPPLASRRSGFHLRPSTRSGLHNAPPG